MNIKKLVKPSFLSLGILSAVALTSFSFVGVKPSLAQQSNSTPKTTPEAEAAPMQSDQSAPTTQPMGSDQSAPTTQPMGSDQSAPTTQPVGSDSTKPATQPMGSMTEQDPNSNPGIKPVVDPSSKPEPGVTPQEQ